MDNADMLKEVSKSQVRALKAISDDMYNLSKTTKNTKPDDEDKFQSNLVMGAFYITSIKLGQKAFKRMVDEKHDNPDIQKGQLDYFLEVTNEWQQENQRKMDAVSEVGV